jgi:hypothetical protein
MKRVNYLMLAALLAISCRATSQSHEVLAAPTIRVHFLTGGDSGSHEFAVEWGAVNGATSYQLEFRPLASDGNWSEAYDGAELQWQPQQMLVAGGYAFHVRAYRLERCGPWSAEQEWSVAYRL